MTTIADILAEHDGREGPLLPILHDAQKAFGHVSEDNMREIASTLNLTRAEVYGVVSFYHDFKALPGQRATLKLCRAEACQARGADALAADDPRIEPVYCLGLCAVGPAAMIEGKVYARLDQAKLAELVASL